MKRHLRRQVKHKTQLRKAKFKFKKKKLRRVRGLSRVGKAAIQSRNRIVNQPTISRFVGSKVGAV